jgi:hypothetical protein
MEAGSAPLAEIPFDQAGIINSAVNYRCRVNVVIQNDGHLSALVLFGKRTKTAGRFAREHEIYLILIRHLGAAIFCGAAEIAARDDGSAA